jgi:DNA-directed RNA polymerase subunit M/transcription elongation factor TFIIS
LIYKNINEKQFCKNCGKVLNVESVKKGYFLYCSGSCKSKHKNNTEYCKNKLKKTKEDCYSVDFSKEVNINVFEKDKKPIKEVFEKIQNFLSRDSKGVGFYNLLNKN